MRVTRVRVFRQGDFIRLAAGLWPDAADLKASPLPPAPLLAGWLSDCWIVGLLAGWLLAASCWLVGCWLDLVGSLAG